MFCNTIFFPSLTFCGLHTKKHGVKGSSKHYHMRFNTKIGHVICEICRTTCACDECKYILDKSWINILKPKQQPRYQPVTDYNYRTVLGYPNNQNIISLSHKATKSKAFEDIHQVFLDGISGNMASLFQSGKYGVINTTETLTI